MLTNVFPELTAEQEAICREVGADWVVELRDQIARIDKRLAEIDGELNPKGIGLTVRKPTGRALAALTGEQLHLRELRKTTQAALRSGAQQAQEQVAAFKRTRDAVIDESEQILKTIIGTSKECDVLAWDLTRRLAKRQQAIAKLKLVVGDSLLRDFLRKAPVVEALGVVGLRDYVPLPDAPGHDRLGLSDHAEQIIAGTVRNEILRLSGKGRADA